MGYMGTLLYLNIPKAIFSLLKGGRYVLANWVVKPQGMRCVGDFTCFLAYLEGLPGPQEYIK